MLELPDGIEIERSEKSEQALVDRCRQWLVQDERKPGLHASDLLNPRLAYFKKKFPEPLQDRLVNIFIVGKFAHAIVLSAVDGVSGINLASDEGSEWSEELGIWHSADKTINGIPRELKTTRSFFEAKTYKDLSLYCEQLMIYMVAKGSLVGQLWVMYLNLKDAEGKTAPQWRVFTIRVTQEDLDKYKKQIKETAGLLRGALESNDPSKLEPCSHQFICGKDVCPYWEECKPDGRYPLKTKKSWTK